MFFFPYRGSDASVEGETGVSLIRGFTGIRSDTSAMARETRDWLIPVALALLIVLAGCSGSGGAEMTGQESSADGTQYQGAEAATAEEKDGGSANDFQARQRAVIRTGKVAVQVDSYDAARRNISRATRQFGGYVSDSSEQVHTAENRSWTTGQLVLRVPRENFSKLLARAKQAGKVQKASTSSKDVTDQLVDIEARLKNLKAQRDELRELYEEANDTENVLEVQERLSEVQTDIERLEARRKSLEQRVAYSTITVQLNEERPEREPPEEEKKWYETGLLSAFVSSINGVVVVLRSIAVATAYALPYAFVFGVPVAGGFALWHRRRSNHAHGADLPNVPDSSESTDEDD